MRNIVFYFDFIKVFYTKFNYSFILFYGSVRTSGSVFVPNIYFDTGQSLLTLGVFKLKLP
jgi:hypothetical protein